MSEGNYTMATVSQFTNRFPLPKNLTRFVTYVTSVAAFTTVGVGPSVSTTIYINGGKLESFPKYLRRYAGSFRGSTVV